MTATIRKSLNAQKAKSRGDAKRTRAVRSLPRCYSDPPRSQASNAPATAHTPSRARPVTKLRTIDETADLFGISSRSVRRLVDSGALPVIRLGRSVRISDPDIAAFLAANRSV
jgi:excisionase family DNA binding protein